MKTVKILLDGEEKNFVVEIDKDMIETSDPISEEEDLLDTLVLDMEKTNNATENE